MLISHGLGTPDLSSLGTRIQTPLGTVRLDGLLDDVSLASSTPTAAWHLQSGGRHLTWETDAFRAEWLLCRPVFERPDPKNLDDCWAGLCRVTAMQDIHRCEFTCRWEQGYQWTEQGPESGQGLDGQAFWSGHDIVAIGTEDFEWLQRRAQRGEFMPKRWKDLLDPEPSGGGVEYLPDGFRTPFPSLNAGEACQVQYVLAWGPEREDGYDARWAIELSPQQILDGGPCR